jgi:hypothetical protein
MKKESSRAEDFFLFIKKQYAAKGRNNLVTNNEGSIMDLILYKVNGRELVYFHVLPNADPHIAALYKINWRKRDRDWFGYSTVFNRSSIEQAVHRIYA